LCSEKAVKILEQRDDLMLLANTEELFLNSNDESHLPAQAATAIKTQERDRLEKLVRYMARPATAGERRSLTAENSIKLRLKNPWRDGPESILFSPSEFIEKLIALIPIPRFHLTSYYGVFANRSQFRSKMPDKPEPPANVLAASIM